MRRELYLQETIKQHAYVHYVWSIQIYGVHVRQRCEKKYVNPLKRAQDRSFIEGAYLFLFAIEPFHSLIRSARFVLDKYDFFSSAANMKETLVRLAFFLLPTKYSGGLNCSVVFTVNQLTLTEVSAF